MLSFESFSFHNYSQGEQSSIDSLFKVEDHAELSTVSTNSFDDFVLVVHAGHFAHVECVILLENGAQVFQELVASRPACVVFIALHDRLVRVWETLVFADEVDNVHAETVYASTKPEAHDVVDRFAHCRILPVEIWLLFAEEAQVVLIRCLIILPSAA